MTEIISSLALSIGKFILSIFVIKNLDLSTKFGLSIFLIIMGLKNIILFIVAVYLPKYMQLDKNLFIISFMISYFALLIVELILIAKILNERNKNSKVKINE